MGEKIAETDVKFEKGYLYYCKPEEGFISVFKTKMSRGGKKKK
jgi:hypothetical protein